MLQPIAQYGLPLNFSASTSALYTGKSNIQGIVVNSHTNGTVKIYDSLTQANTVVFNTITFAAGPGFYNLFGAKCLTGVSITIGGTIDATLMVTPYTG